MRTTTNGPARLAWDERGEGPPLLLVMGHRFSSAMWRWTLDGLARERRVIFFDNRGTGATNAPPGPYTMQDLAGDAFAVMDAAGVTAADIYGASMGGMIAQTMALSKPERVKSLILGCTTARSPLTKPSPLRHLQYRVPSPIVMRLGRGLLYGSVARPERIAEDQALLLKERPNARGLIGQAQAIAGFDVLPRLKEIRQPTLVIHGSEDKVLPLTLGREVAAGIANSQLVVLEGSGHNYLADAAEASTEAVLTFLRSLDKTRSQEHARSGHPRPQHQP